MRGFSDNKSMLSSITRSLLHPLSPGRVATTTEEEAPTKPSNLDEKKEPTTGSQQLSASPPSIFSFENPLSSFFRVEPPATQDQKVPHQITSKTEQQHLQLIVADPSNGESSSYRPSDDSALPSSSKDGRESMRHQQQAAHLLLEREPEQQGVELVIPSSIEMGNEEGDDGVEIQFHAHQAMIFQYENNGSTSASGRHQDEERNNDDAANADQLDQAKAKTDKLEERQLELSAAAASHGTPTPSAGDTSQPGDASLQALSMGTGVGEGEKEKDCLDKIGENELGSKLSLGASSHSKQDLEELMRLQSLIQQYEETSQENSEEEVDGAAEDASVELSQGSLSQQESQDEGFLALQAMIAQYENQQPAEETENGNVENETPAEDPMASASQSLQEPQSACQLDHSVVSDRECSHEEMSTPDEKLDGILNTEQIETFQAAIENEREQLHQGQDKDELPAEVTEKNFSARSDLVEHHPSRSGESCDTEATSINFHAMSVSQQGSLEQENVSSFSDDESCGSHANASDQHDEDLLALRAMIANYEDQQNQLEEAPEVSDILAADNYTGGDAASDSACAQTEKEEDVYTLPTMGSSVVEQTEALCPLDSGVSLLRAESVLLVTLRCCVGESEQASEPIEKGIAITNLDSEDSPTKSSLEGDAPVKATGSKYPLLETEELDPCPNENSMSTRDSHNQDKPFMNVAVMTTFEKNLLLIRELKHVLLRGPNMFESIEDKIVSWQHEEVQRQSQSQQKQGSSQDSCSKSSKEVAVDQKQSAVVKDSFEEDRPRLKASGRPALAKAKSQHLIRELEFVQTQGPDIFDSIDDKVKTWQKQESLRQLQGQRSLEMLSASEDEANDRAKIPVENRSDHTRPEDLTALDENCKSRQNTIPTSESTESTHSCSSNCSESLTTCSEIASLSRQQTTVCDATSLDICPDRQSIDPFEWDAPAHVSALVDGVLGAPAAISPERASAGDFDEVTVHSVVESVSSDDEEWTIMDSLEDQPDVFEFFDFDNMDIEDEGEEYGVIGHGISDSISVLSELTTPSAVSTTMQELLPPRKAPRHGRIPFQQVKLRRAQSNPSRLPHMRQAAILLLLQQQLKPVDVSDQNLSNDQHSPGRTIRRSYSDKAVREYYSNKRIDSESSKLFPRPPPNVGGGGGGGDDSKCILDFSWDELDEFESTDVEDYEDVSIEEISLPAPRYPPLPPSGAKQIGKIDSFYDSVSISFLASTIRDQTIVQVMDEALRILQTGGILNVLDINGSVVERIQEHSKYQALSFQKATAKDQERVETSTLTILEKCGLNTKFSIADPCIIHWTASKPQ